MWETEYGSSYSSGANANASSYSNRGVLLLLTVLLACLLLYKAWGPLLFITLALTLVVHVCYSLLVNDSLLAPYTLVLLGYAKELCLEAIITAKLLSGQGFQKSKKYYHYLKLWYLQCYIKLSSEQQSTTASAEDNMNGRHRNVYRLSTMNDLADQISPVNNDPYQSFALNGTASNVARTSTPLPRELIWRKGAQSNGDIGQFTPICNPQNKKTNSLRSENKQPSLTLSHNETVYSPKSSPWSKKGKDSVVKTVQTVAGPLLTSTRFNVDPKLYSDINSPGLSSRLTKYALEANNKLIHQHQYGAGQFPKVNLNASPTPLLSPKVVRSRMPVTVRVAPPEMTSYCPPDIQNQEKFKNTSPSEAKESVSAPSVVKVLKKISLKRHASREDIMLELVKKQRSERALREDQLENLEEMMQKRAREESITSEEDLSPQSKTERPLKRPKAASSCHDILNSLSSSLHVLSGVKRKAMDTSRSNTPDIEKHFKPSSRSPTRTMSLNIFLSREPATLKEQLNQKIPIARASGEPYQQTVQVEIPETKKSIQHSPEQVQSETPKAVNAPILKIHEENSASNKFEKLTDKLFMRAEPQSKEKVKDIINESTAESKFITDDKDEIKKQDIINMRQNSIRLRLQSMANAISGKSTNKIDPDVVIQAEEINPLTSSAFTSLSSLTTTTTVNTSPITTTIVPILKVETESKSPTKKHVTFNLPSSSLSFSSATSSTSNLSALSSNELTKPVTSEPVATSNFLGFSSTTTSAPTYNFGSSSTASATSAAAMPTSANSNTTSSGFTLSANIAASKNSSNVVSNSLNTSVNSSPSLFTSKPTTADGAKTTVSRTSSGFSFGSTLNSNSTITVTTTATSKISFGTSKTTTSTCEQTNSINSTITPTFGNSLTKSPASVSLAPTTTSNALPSFGGEKKTGFSFGAQTSSNTSSTTASIFGTSSSAPMFSASNNALTTSAAQSTSTPPRAFSFGSRADKPASTFSFGGSATASTTNPSSMQPSSIAFGSGGQMLGASSSINTVPTFGAPTSASSASHSTVGASNSTFDNSTSSVFGTSTNSPSLFSGTTNSSAMFKNPTASAASTTSPAIFGSGTPGFGALSAPSSAAPTPILFGNSLGLTTTSSKTPSLFGAAVAASTATNAPSAASAASPFSGSTAQQQGSIFSGMPSVPATTSSSIFGSAPSSSGLFSGNSTTGQTSTNMISTSNSTDGGGVFGQSKSTSSLTFGATGSTFGSSNSTSTFASPSTNNTTPAFQIGNNTSASGSLPVFGAIKSPTQFGTSPALNQTNSGSLIFGSTTGSGFGATTNPAPATFGSTSTSSAFGMQSNANAASSAFGTTSPSFGNSAGTLSPFGTAPSVTTTSSLFGSSTVGTATNAPTGGSASFSFGGSQATQQPQQSQQASFSFGGTANNNAGGGIFQFGASNAAKPGGFNFSTATAAPTINFTGGTAPPAFNAGAPGAAPAFNAAASNMFSIGSGGSSTPRSRSSRPRRGR